MSDKLKPCPFCGGRANWGVSTSRIWIECTRCDARTGWDMDQYKQRIIDEWNTRISFNWLATVAALQMWKDAQRLRREDYEAFEDARSGHALAERLLTEATQTLDRLCGDGEQDAVVRELSGKLNEWLAEAMPF